MRKNIIHRMICVCICFVFTTGIYSVSAQGIFGSRREKKRIEKEKQKIKEDSLVFSGKSKSMRISLRDNKKDFLIIDWVKPDVEKPTLTDGLLEIKVKIFSGSVIQKENIVLYHNQQRLSSKMDVSGLFGKQNEFNYSNKIALTEGVNEIVVQVSTDKISKSSDPLIVHKQGKNISVRPMGSSMTTHTNAMSIYWWTVYDPVTLKGEPYACKDEFLPVKFKILTTENVQMSNLIVWRNGVPHAPGPTATLEKDYQGNFSFVDQVRLVEISGYNEIFLEVKTPASMSRSEKLRVNYSPFRPTLHVLSIGTATNLQFTLKDAKDFTRLFIDQGNLTGSRLFNKISIDTLIGKKATAQEIKGTIEELKIRYFTGSIKSDDVILTFISSHGFLLNGDFRVQGDDYSPARQKSTSVSFKNDIIGIFDDIPCKKIIMIDACHSGGARDNVADINMEINKLNSIAKGTTVIASSRGEEQSYEDPVWQNGAFTSAIVNGLASGKADTNSNHIITLHELYDYVSKEVASMVKKVKSRDQNPILVNDELGDVAIYVIP